MWYNIESFAVSNHAFHISFPISMYGSKKGKKKVREGGKKYEKYLWSC